MNILSSRLGEVTVPAGDLISFPDGFIGLPEWQQAVRLPFSAEVPILSWLQFTHDPDAAFLLLDIAAFTADYDCDLARQTAALAPTAEVFTIVAVPAGDFASATTNLLAPVVIDRVTPEASNGKQVVLHDTAYPLRHPLFRSDD